MILEMDTLKTELLDHSNQNLGESNENVQTRSFILGFDDCGRETPEYVTLVGEESCSMEVSWDVAEYQDNGNYIKIDWAGAIQLWLLAIIFLPLYIMAMIVDIRKNCPKILSKTKAIFILVSSLLFLVAIWTSFGLWVQNRWLIVTKDEIILMWLLFLISCGAETVLKSSFYIKQTSYTQLVSRLTQYKLEDKTAYQIFNTMIRPQDQSSQSKLFLILNLILSLGYEIAIELIRWLSPHPELEVTPSLVWYLILSGYVRISLIYLWLHYLSAALMQITQRNAQAKLFTALTNRYSSCVHHLPYLQLSSNESFRLWMMLRSLLLSTFQEPKAYVDIVLSASMALTGPLLTYIFYSLYVGFLTPNLYISLLLTMIIFTYIVLCMLLIVITREKFNETGVLAVAKLRILYDTKNESKHNIALIDAIYEILTRSNNDAVLFHIFGLSINKQMTTLCFGLGLSLISTLLSHFLM